MDPLAEKYIGFSPYNFTLGNPVRLVDVDGRKNEDWYEKLDKDGKGTGKIIWVDGKKEYKGYKRLGHDAIVNSTDVNGNRTSIKYEGKTKSSYIYNSKTAKWDLLKDYTKDTKYASFDEWAKKKNINVLKEMGNSFLRGLKWGVIGKGAEKTLNPKDKTSGKATLLSLLIGGFIETGRDTQKLLNNWQKSLSPEEIQAQNNLRECGRKIQMKYGKDPEE